MYSTHGLCCPSGQKLASVCVMWISSVTPSSLEAEERQADAVAKSGDREAVPLVLALRDTVVDRHRVLQENPLLLGGRDRDAGGSERVVGGAPRVHADR
eukprot:297256-Prymnesium_polylepis.1